MPVVQSLVAITALRRGPQDLPYSPGLLAGVVGINAILHLAALTLAPWYAGDVSVWLPLAISLGYTALFFDGVLQLRDLGHRRVKTLTAVFGTDCVVGLVLLIPITLGDWQSPSAPGLATLVTALTLWQLAILTHILRHALSARLGEAIGWTLAYGAGTVVLHLLLGGSA